MNSMLEFIVPVHLEDLALSYTDRYVVHQRQQQHHHHATNATLNAIECVLDDNVLSLYSHDVFDAIYWLIRDMIDDKSISVEIRARVLSLLTTGLSSLLDSIQNTVSSRDAQLHSEYAADKVYKLRNALTMYVFAIANTLNINTSDTTKTSTTKDKSASKHAGVVWHSAKERACGTLLLTLDIASLFRVWPHSKPPSEFGCLFWRTALTLLREPTNARHAALRSSMFSLMNRAVQLFDLEATASFELLTVIQGSETAASLVAHFVEHVAQHSSSAINITSDENQSSVDGGHDDENSLSRMTTPSLASALLCDIARLDYKQLARDALACKCIAVFLTELGSLVPAAVCASLSVLLPALGAEAYALRIGIVRMLCSLLRSGILDAKDSVSRDALLHLLLKRCLDTSSYVRCAVLVSWRTLCESSRLPLLLLPQVLDVARQRLVDKSVIVRKHSVQLCIALMQHNPFGACLSPTAFQERSDTLSSKITALRCVDEESKRETITTQQDDDDDDDGSNKAHANVSTAQHAADNIAHNSNSSNNDDTDTAENVQSIELQRAVRELSFFTGALELTSQLHIVLQSTLHLLRSKISSDTLIAIQFLISAHAFQVSGASLALKHMLPLVFSKHTEVNDAVVEAYFIVFVHDKPTKKAIENFIDLAAHSTPAEYACLQIVVQRLIDTKKLNKNHIRAVLSVLDDASSNPTRLRGAMDVLSMAANSDVSLVTHNIESIMKTGFSASACHDAWLVRSTCVALQHLNSTGSIPSLVTTAKQHTTLDDAVVTMITNNLLKVLRAQFGGHIGQNWFVAAEQAMNALFRVSKNAHSLINQLLQEWITKLYHDDSVDSEAQRVDEGEDSHQTPHNGLLNTINSSLALAQFFFLVGHTAIRMLVYTEDLEAQWKYMNQHRQQTHDENMKRVVKAEHGDNEADDKEEFGGGSDEYEIEILRERAQLSLLQKNHMLGAIAPFIVSVVSNPEQYSAEILQVSSTLALCKLMCVSDEFCERHLQLLFTIAARSTSATIRANIMIALGDMAFRFPNLLVPWTSQMYAPLKDADVSVRKNALMVLSHLVLNDMIKVKGEISSMVLCLNDSNSAMVDLAKLFFSELSRKANHPIYNVLPDTISRLLHVECVDEDVFVSLATYLLDFIDKEREIESLIEKLCHRFQATLDAAHWRGLAHCVSCLRGNSDKPNGGGGEKCVRRVMMLLPAYKHALLDEQVFNTMSAMMARARKSAANNKSVGGVELIDAIDEYERRIGAYHRHEDPDDEDKNRNDDEDKENVSVNNARRQQPRRGDDKKSGRKAMTKKKVKAKWEISSDDDDDDEMVLATPNDNASCSGVSSIEEISDSDH